jgi:DHA1 family multidrug resistance protein-like MFS transporter
MMFAGSLWILILIRVAASFFSGTVNAAQTLVASVTPEEKQGFALGAISTAVSTGYMTGFFLGGMVVDKYGFDAGFIICGVCFFISGLLVLPVKENFVPAVKAPVEGKKHFWELMAGYGTFLRCLIWMILITNFMRSFDNPYLALLVAQSSEPGTAAANTGFISAAAALGGVISGVTIGYLADRFPPRYLLVPLLITAGAMLLCQSFCRSIVLFMVLRFLGFMAAGGIDPVIQRLISSHAGPARRGTVFGVMQGFSVGGVMFSALVSGGVVYLAGVKGVFVTAGILYILCALVAFRILSAGQESGTPPVGSDV